MRQAAPGCLLRGGKIAKMLKYCSRAIKFCASPEKVAKGGGGGGAPTHFFFRLQKFFHTHFVMGYGYYHGHDRLRWQAKKKKKKKKNHRGATAPPPATPWRRHWFEIMTIRFIITMTWFLCKTHTMICKLCYKLPLNLKYQVDSAARSQSLFISAAFSFRSSWGNSSSPAKSARPRPSRTKWWYHRGRARWGLNCDTLHTTMRRDRWRRSWRNLRHYPDSMSRTPDRNDARDYHLCENTTERKIENKHSYITNINHVQRFDKDETQDINNSTLDYGTKMYCVTSTLYNYPGYTKIDVRSRSLGEGRVTLRHK